MKHCQRHGPERHPYCVDCYKDEFTEYRERAHAGQTTEDDAEIYGHGEDSESDCGDDESADGSSESPAYNAKSDAPT